MNKFIPPKKKETVVPEKTFKAPEKSFLRVFDPENYLKFEWFAKNMAFIGFVLVVLLMYIANTHYAEKQVRIISNTEKELKNLRWKYTISKSELMFNSKQSEVAKKLKPYGFLELTETPKALKIASK